MELFNLPKSTIVNRNVPKNAFDQYTNTKQKRRFTDLVEKIQWQHKLSKDTVNLSGEDIKEIQIFRVALKEKEDISDLLKIIDKAIPYHLVFAVSSGPEAMISATEKHPHPADEGKAVIDWTFASPWFAATENPYQLHLQQSLDFVFADLCNQLSGKNTSTTQPLADLVSLEKKLKELNYSIDKLKAAMKKAKQFNQRVELNRELQKKVAELEAVEIRGHYKGP